MNLILVRHAEAVRLGEEGTETDADRPLTALGRTHAARLADAFAARGVTPGAVVTSGLVRAVQTAEPLLRLFPGDPRAVEVCQYLAPENYRPRKLTRFVLGLGQEVTILVGHNPDLSTYAAWLLGTDDGAVDLDKGAALLVRFDGEPRKGAGQIRWLITLEWFAG